MTGYIRQDTSNNIANGNVIDADDLDGEFNAVESAFNSSTGHNHDGTSGNGAPILAVGPAQDVVTSSVQMAPKANNTYDLGSSASKWKDLYVDGVAYIDAINLNGTAVSATATELNYTGGVTSAIQTQLNAKAPVASPTFTGVPAAPTATLGTNTTQIATTAFVQSALSGSGLGDMLKAVYDSNDDGYVNKADTWTTPRTVTIGSTGKSVDGSANVSWSLSEIGVGSGTLTLSTSGIATGSQTFGANQGTNATFTVNVPATDLSVTAGTTSGPTINSSTGTDVVIPSASATASGVVTTGAQTFAGTKTFSTVATTSLTLGGSSVTASAAEINYLVGVTSAVQTQLNTKAPTSSPTLSNTTLNSGYTEQVFAVSGTTPALSPTNGSIQTWTLSGNSTPAVGTWAAGQSLTLLIDDGSSYSITWTSLSVVWKTDKGTAPELNTSGDTVIGLWKVGTTIYGARVGDA